MKKLPVVIFAYLFVCLLPGNQIQAASPDLYLGVVPVMDQSKSEQARAMPIAMAQVLQKLSGLRDFSEYPEFDQALSMARAMTITFYYRNMQFTLPDGEKVDELHFLVKFSQSAIDGLMQELQLPIWKPERPPIMVWLVIDDGVSRKVMPIELEYAWERIASIAEQRGMPIVRPQADANGQYPVDLQLLWGGYTEDLDQSGNVEVLAIAGRQEGPEWNLRMNLDYVDRVLSWRNRDSDIQIALAEGINTAIDEIAAANSIVASDRGQWNVEITVTGIATDMDYIRCLAYLQEVSLVEHVDVRRASPGRVRFGLGLQAVPAYLAAALTTGGVLAETDKAGEYELLP